MDLLFIFVNIMEFDQYLGFLLFLTVLTMGFWLMILLLTFIIPYWVTGSFIERMKEIRDKLKK
tara:strand:- start:103 stop:291 length:189 start_codon:yes stop_codon:yes gene_type:complete